MDIKSAATQPEKLYPWHSVDREHVIGVLRPCYGSGHVIYGLRPSVYEYRNLPTLPLDRLDSRSTFFQYTLVVLDASVKLVHSWNSIPVNKDFIVSFELELPRYLGAPSEAQLKRGMEMLASPRCKAILALSEFALSHAKHRFRQRGFPELIDKLQLFRGAMLDPLAGPAPQARRKSRTSFAEAPLSAIVIGTTLFRKGGTFAVEAFEKLRAEGLNVTLTLIGDFESDDYAFGECIPDADEWRARCRKHPWIRFQGPMPNAEVLNELRQHDICLYPSLDESLGWLIVEAAMVGMPVLGNRVCAVPELIEHRKTGWLVDLPLGPLGRWAGIDTNQTERKAHVADATALINAGIEDCMRFIYQHPQVLDEWGAAGRRKMISMYDMDDASKALNRVYDVFMKEA